MVGRSVYACRHSSSSPRAAFWWVLNALEACRHGDYRHPNKVPETNELPVGQVADERVDSEAIFDFLDQLPSRPLRLSNESSENNVSLLK
jgi:hypothetical protein